MAYYDPYVPVIRPTREHPHWAGTKSVELNKQTVSKFDAVLVATAHSAVDHSQLLDWSPCIIDTRNSVPQINAKPNQLWRA